MKNKAAIIFLLCALGVFLKPVFARALSIPENLQNKTPEQLKSQDTDFDLLSDYDEMYVFKTDPLNPDTDSDGWKDGIEVNASYDPNVVSDDKIPKSIEVDLKSQSLSYFLGTYKIGEFKISSGVAKMQTPKGDFSVIKKLPLVTYGSRSGSYYYPNTKWNLLFKYQTKGNIYIHGAYWHNNFGTPMSHGCVNVAYGDMENLYNWADVGTKILIH